MELVDENLIALHVDTTEHAIVRYTHYNHLILVVAAALLLEPDALWCNFGLRVVCALLLCLAIVCPLPEGASVETRARVLLI